MPADDPRLEPALDRAFRWVDRAIRAGHGQPPGFTALLCARLEALRGVAAADPRQFVPVAVPVALAGSDTPLAAAACTALHLADALMAVRSDLAGASGGEGYRDLVGHSAADAATSGVDPGILAAAGQVSLSVALGFLGDLDDAAPAMRTAAFAAKRLAGGRARALETLGAGHSLDSAGALELARLETGCAFACCAQIAAIAGDLPGETWTGLWRWGEALGAAQQLETQAALLAAADPAAVAHHAYLVSHLRDEARQVLGSTWLPWGARPILERAGALRWRPAHRPA